jgi:hypothetical protein
MDLDCSPDRSCFSSRHDPARLLAIRGSTSGRAPGPRSPPASRRLSRHGVSAAQVAIALVTLPVGRIVIWEL